MTSQTPESLRERLLTFFAKHPSETFKTLVIARRLSLETDEEVTSLRTLLNELHDSGEVHRDKGSLYGRGVAPLSNRVTGLFKAIKQGQGIVETTGPGRVEKILITQKFRGTAIDGDTVSVSVFARPADADPEADTLAEGEVVEVVVRRKRSIIGTFEKGKNFFFVIPDSSRIGRDIYIPSGKTAGARPGEKVAARVLSWESEQLNPEGEIVTVLGKAGEVHVEMKGIREEFQLPEAFPAGVLQEVARIEEDIPPGEISSRLDLRDVVAFTIDPADAKDHDDALSIRELKDGRLEIGVHIADVSHYVTEGSALDAEAMERGTSVYLPGTVIPMLPEKLSADLCSLMPEVDRLSYSTMLIFSRDGELEDYTIRKSVIHCREGFSYEDAQKIIDDRKGPCAKELLELHRISLILLAARSRNGSIDFDVPEVAFRFDDSGLPSQIVKKERLASHRLIEEFMLQANQVVAAHIGRIRKGTEARPFVYRIHDHPDPAKLRDFGTFVQHLGYSFNAKTGVTSAAFQKLLESVHGKEEENVINQIAIRSMAKAVYSDENIGHFGLGFKYYTHFTSPIRRYPDLIVHRLLHEYETRGAKARVSHWAANLNDICRHSSAREKIATDAERASIKVMQVEYMKRHVGDVFHALISGVTNFGLFVEINDLLVEGLIRLRDLKDDYYIFDEKHYRLVGKRTNQVYRLGDKVTVKVVRVDPEEREMDFMIVDVEGNEKRGERGRGNAGGGRSGQEGQREPAGRGRGRGGRGGDGRGTPVVGGNPAKGKEQQQDRPGDRPGQQKKKSRGEGAPDLEPRKDRGGEDTGSKPGDQGTGSPAGRRRRRRRR